MVRVCAEPTCKTSARFNHPGQLRGMFCSRHKEVGMVDVVHARCAVAGCMTLASFNVQGLPRGVLCSMHKQARPPARADLGDLGCGGRPLSLPLPLAPPWLFRAAASPVLRLPSLAQLVVINSVFSL